MSSGSEGGRTTMDTIDFRPSTTAMARVLAGIGDDQVSAATPCPDYTVADLVEHVVGLTAEFTASASKTPGPGARADADASRLPDDWRESMPARLDDLAIAWADPAAYDGMTHAGPIDLPASEAAKVALNEVVVHAWDLAVATGQEYDADPAAVAVCIDFVESFDAPANDDGGLFGPPVSVPDDAPALDRLVGLTGRRP
ncbi:MAG: TIGR03086 family metal-binding protein [Nocardioides sp.]